MACHKEGSEGVVPTELLELVLLESNLQGGEAQVQVPEQRPSSPAGDNQPVKPLVVGGPVEAWVHPAEALQQHHTWEEENGASVVEMKFVDMVELQNEGKNENEDEHKQEGKQDLGPVLEKDLEQSCWSTHHSGIQRLPQSGRGPAKRRSKMEELELLQLELSFVNARCSGAFARIKAMDAKMRRAHLEHRKTIIQAIPGFWPKAVSLNDPLDIMMNHPQLSAIITNQDEELLHYMLSLEVVESKHWLRMCRMMFVFSDNPYFRNEIVTKDYEISITGYKESDSSVIEWLRQPEHGYANCMQDTTRLTFFNWLCAHKLPGSNRIAEIIMDDLWPNPLYYFPKEDHS